MQVKKKAKIGLKWQKLALSSKKKVKNWQKWAEKVVKWDFKSGQN